MNNITVVGLQWGDEAKAKVVDNFAQNADIVVRSQGGPNAGHTVIVNDKKFVFHCVPAGILYPDCVSVIGAGVVLDLESFNNELQNLLGAGISLKNLKISPKVHLITPDHKARDAAREAGANSIGTTKRGIGPCYSDKAARSGIRLLDVLNNPVLRNRLVYENFSLDSVNKVIGFIEPFVTDTQSYLQNNNNSKNIIFEGAQGLMLDLDHGTYPFVTSSATHPASAAISNGLPPSALGKICGVTKAYTTRVGKGCFPTELLDEKGERIRQIGKEFGSTTGRPRRCGWLDLVQLDYAIKMSGTNILVLTKADVLAGMEKIKVCINYENQFKWGIDWDIARPEYLELPGFPVQNWKEIKSYNQVSDELKDYISFIENAVGCNVSFLSLGPERDSLIKISEGI